MRESISGAGILEFDWVLLLFPVVSHHSGVPLEQFLEAIIPGPFKRSRKYRIEDSTDDALAHRDFLIPQLVASLV